MVETIKSQVDVDQINHSKDKERSTKPTHVKPRELYFKQAPDKNTTIAKSQLPSNQVTASEKALQLKSQKNFLLRGSNLCQRRKYQQNKRLSLRDLI